MVDFLKKTQTQNAKDHDSDTDSDSNVKNVGEIDDDPWIDTVDDFGRTRLMRQSAVDKIKSDKLLQIEKSIQEERKREYQSIIDGQNEQIEDKDDKDEESKEKERVQKEEFEEEMEKRKREATHFDSRKEIRTMGVGFYQFSNNDTDRKHQMDNLNALRDDTILERKTFLNIKEAKRKAKEDRILAIHKKAKAHEDKKEQKLKSASIDALLGTFK